MDSHDLRRSADVLSKVALVLAKSLKSPQWSENDKKIAVRDCNLFTAASIRLVCLADQIDIGQEPDA